MGGPGGDRTMSEEEMRDMFGGGGGEDPFSDFFRTFFGGAGGPGAGEGRGRGRASRSQKGRDIESEAELTLEEAYHGAMRRDLDHPRRPRAQHRRAHPAGRQGQLARAGRG